MRISNSALAHTETLASPFLHGLHTYVVWRPSINCCETNVLVEIYPLSKILNSFYY
jgi:hypothetical protein